MNPVLPCPWDWATRKATPTVTPITARRRFSPPWTWPGGRFISSRKPGHRTRFISFLRRIDANTPPGLDPYVSVDNHATHKHPRVRLWLARHPCFHFPFTPTYSCWPNQVEIFFGIITRQAIRRGSFSSVKGLEHSGVSGATRAKQGLRS